METNKINLVLITKDKSLYELFEIVETKENLLWKRSKSGMVYHSYFLHSEWDKYPKDKAVEIIRNLVPAYRLKTKNDFKVTLI